MSAEWIKRPYLPEEDESALVYLWCNSYLRSSEGIARGCYEPGKRADEQRNDEAIRAAARAMWAEQAPLVEQLLASTRVEVICDPERVRTTDAGPAVIWAFAATSNDVVHYVCVKRGVPDEQKPRIVRDLLGSRLDRRCSYTHELVEMLTGGCGVRQPASWRLNEMWLARHLAGRRRVAQAHESVRT